MYTGVYVIKSICYTDKYIQKDHKALDVPGESG